MTAPARKRLRRATRRHAARLITLEGWRLSTIPCTQAVPVISWTLPPGVTHGRFWEIVAFLTHAVRVTGFRPARRHAAWVLNLECWILSPMPCGSVITGFQPSNTRILNAISRSRAHTCARPGHQARLAKTIGGGSFLSRRRLSGSDH